MRPLKVPPDGADGTGFRWVWLTPGERKDVLIYRPLTDSPIEALEAAERMVLAHEVDWVHLRYLTRERDRWAITATVCGRARQDEAMPEAML